MREVTRDEKWVDEDGTAHDVPDSMSLNAVDEQVLNASPSEETLVIIALLMRIYDVQLAQLASIDENRANQVYEAHEKGEHFNPPVFIPIPKPEVE